MDINEQTKYIDKENRIIYICGQLDNISMPQILFELVNLIEEDNIAAEAIKDYIRIPIKIFLETQGGYISIANNLINIILNSKTPIYTYALGDCMSSGFLVFIAGHKRYVGKYSTLMYHQILSGTSYTCEHIKDFSEQLSREQNNIEDYVSKQTYISKEKLKEIRQCQRDWYLTSDEALQLGVATDLYKGL